MIGYFYHCFILQAHSFWDLWLFEKVTCSHLGIEVNHLLAKEIFLQGDSSVVIEQWEGNSTHD